MKNNEHCSLYLKSVNDNLVISVGEEELNSKW